MEYSSITEEKIKQINDGKWTINCHELYVEIKIENVSGDTYWRKINLNELTAIKTQIEVLNLDITSNSIYGTFIDHFKKMKEYQIIVEYLNHQGIAKFESIKGKSFESFEKKFNTKKVNFKEIYQNCQKTDFFLKSIQCSVFRTIGKVIQENEDYNIIYAKLRPYFICVLGTNFQLSLFLSELQTFMKRLGYDMQVMFDAFKLGYEFCEYLTSLKNYQKYTCSINRRNSFIFDSIKNLDGENYLDKLTQTFSKYNLLFFKVIRPAHCYHCIMSTIRIISNFVYDYPFCLNERQLIFCQNGEDFVERINQISKDRQNLTYFIVHPEMLNEEYHSFLVEFLNARMNSLYDRNLPKVLIISSLDYQSFCCKNLSKFNDIELDISKQLIEYLCQLSYPEEPASYSYQLYYSENAGSGKTHQILQDFQDKKNCIDDKFHVLQSLFADNNMKKFSKIKFYENNGIREYRYVHFDLSPDLFDSNYQFFDDLWIFCSLHYHIDSDGENINTPNNIFFEVPSLTKKQFPDGGFISYADFPIYANYYHKISANEKEKVHNEGNIKILVEAPAVILLPKKVKEICDFVFKDEIKSTSQLLSTALKMFYPDFEFKESSFVPRILDAINIFMEEFCQNLVMVDEKSVIIFLLLLRTNFHIWNMESLFTEKSQPKSFIIFTNQSLLSSSHDTSKWILLHCTSKDEKNVWNTDCLKSNFGKIDESKILDNKHFKPLFDDKKNVEIYSNNLNYINDQTYFFSIIRTFFYLNSNKDTKYRKITDGVISNVFINNDSFKEQKHIFEVIAGGRDEYEKMQKITNISKWNKSFDTLHSIFNDYKGISPYDILMKLADGSNEKEYYEYIKEISKITLTMTIVKRFVTMIIRIILKQPLILEGSTGVGKTWTVNLLRLLMEIAKRNDDFKWRFHQIDCHGALHLDELLRIKEDEMLKDYEVNLNNVFFFDKLNTSPVSNYVINEMNKYHLKKKYKLADDTDNEFDKSSIVFMAAINPYIKVDKFSQNLSQVGIKQIIPDKISNLRLCNITPKDHKNLYDVIDLNNELAYNVSELSKSAEMIIIKSDPELFYFDDSDYNDKEIVSSIYLTPDEIHIIGHIVDCHLNKLIELSDYRYYANNLLENYKRTIIEDRYKRQQNLAIIEKTIKNNKDKIARIILKSLCKSFSEIRELMQLKSILTYRDVKRTMQFFLLFFQKLLKVYYKKEEGIDITFDVLTGKIIPQSIVLSLMLSIVFRFSNETGIETVDGNISDSSDKEEEILKRFAKFGLNLAFSIYQTYYKVGIRSVLLKKLENIEWCESIKNPGNWNQIVISYAWMKCMKYVYINDTEVNSSLFKHNSLIIHLFAISSCYSACKNNRDSVIPCMIIGMPGTSKSLAIQLFTDYKNEKSKERKSDDFFSTTHLSTRASEAESFESHFKECAMFMMAKENNFAVCVIDELGLANLNESHPLNLLHYYFDKGVMIDSDGKPATVPVMSIVTSKYSLDYAIMNRCVLICTDLPTDKEIAEAFYLSELESENGNDDDDVEEPRFERIDKNKINEYEKRYFEDFNDIFIWKGHKKAEKYEKFLQILWNLTDSHERPDMLTLHPLYFLFNTIFHNRVVASENEIIYNLCLYLISIIACKPNDSFEKLLMLLTELHNQFKDDQNVQQVFYYAKNHKTNGFNAIKEIFSGQKESSFYDRFSNIVKKQANSKKKNDLKKEFRKVYEVINEEDKNKEDEDDDEEEDEEDPFNYVYYVLNHKEEDRDLYNSLEAISTSVCFKKLIKDINNRNFDNYKILRQLIISNLNRKSNLKNRAFCFRTKNYECLDFIEELINDITYHYDRTNEYEAVFIHIYPTDFKASSQEHENNSIEILLDKIIKLKLKEEDEKRKRKKKENEKEKEKLYFFLIVGNARLTDSLLDLLNIASEGLDAITTKRPLLSRNGLTIELDKYPTNIFFCFIMNEKDFQNQNPIDSYPIPLLNRLNQLYLDYNERDEFGIIEKYKKFNEINSKFSTPYSSIIHEYFNRFVSNLKSVPIPKAKNEFSCVFATTDINLRAFKKDVECQEFNLNDDYDDFLEFDRPGYAKAKKYDDDDDDDDDDENTNREMWKSIKRVILVIFYQNAGDLNYAYMNIKKLLNEANYGNKLTFYCSTEFDEFYEINKPYLHSKDKDVFHIPLPKPDNYDFLNNDGSINLLIDSIYKSDTNEEEEEGDDGDKKSIKAIILTTSPMMEDIMLYKSDFGITKDDTLFMFDQYITSSQNFHDRIDEAIQKRKDQANKKLNIVVQLNHFQIEHDRYLRYLLEDRKESIIQNRFIIYHLENSKIPEGLYSSKEWPLYWIESITDSHLSRFKTTEIVNCVLFTNYYKSNMKSLFTRVFHKVYTDIDAHYEYHIKGDKVEQILDFIFDVYKEKKIDGHCILELVDFTDLFDKFEGRTIKNSYETLNFKREFYNAMVRQVPNLDHLIKVLILSYHTINVRKIDDTFTFIKTLLDFDDIDDIFKMADIDNRDYEQVGNDTLYFPELVFPQVFAIYNAIKDKKELPEINKQAFEIFIKLQILKEEEVLEYYCQNYFMTYLFENNIYDPDFFNDTFLVQFLDLMK